MNLLPATVRLAIPLLCASLFSASWAGPQVISVSPAPQSLNTTVLGGITIQFDTPLDSATVNSATIMIAGRWSGIARGTFALDSSRTLVQFTPSDPFSAGETVTISVSRGVQSEGGEPMDLGYAWSYWIKTSPGTLELTEVQRIPVREPGEGHIQTYGANTADLDNDGWTDLTLPNELSDDIRVFMNDGQGGYSDFTIHPIPNGNLASANEAVDLDGDADLDFVVGNGGNDRMSVFIGDGMGGFVSSTSYQAGNSVRGVAAMDLEGDGDLDIVTTNRGASNLSIFMNNGDGTFQPAMNMEGNGVQETACAVADANEDGIMDLFVGALSSNEMILLLGDGNGGLVFSDEVGAGGSPWVIAAGDVNGDGHVDVVSANSFANNAAVILGDGMGGMLPAVNYPVGNFALAIDLGDIDGDGDLDFVTSNYSTADWTLYENNGTGVFVNPKTFDASSAGSCATLHDRDNDGDLDMTGIDEIDDLIFLFDNQMPVSVPPPFHPGTFALHQNTPNPFNPRTTIRYQITDYCLVSLHVYDVLGRVVATLLDEFKVPGTYEITWDAEDRSSGVYFYRLQSAGFSETRKMVLNK
jgi:hypothetical protein